MIGLGEAIEAARKPLPQPVSASLWKPSVDIVIPTHRGRFEKGKPTWGLHLTIESCEADLKNSGIDYRYYIVSNGNPQTGDERDSLNMSFDFAEKTGRVGKIFDTPEAMAPPNARNLGVRAGTGEVLFFFDDHIKVHPGFFQGSLDTMHRTGCAAVFGPLVHSKTGARQYHHAMREFLADYFWAGMCLLPANPLQPYRIASGNHGAFCIRRSDFQEVGCYWEGFTGWAGEEPELNLKLWMMDKEIYFTPHISHWHFFADRRYKRDARQTALNQMMVANIIGGKKWAARIANNVFAHQLKTIAPDDRETIREREKTVLELYDKALAKSAEQARWMQEHRKRTLEEQLALFEREGVAM